MKTAGFSPVALHTGEGGSAFPVQCQKGLINTTTVCGDTLGLAPSSLDTFAHTPAWEKGCEWEKEVSLKSCFSLALQGACVLLPPPFRVVVIDCSVAWCLLAAAASCAVSVATRCRCLDQREGTFCHRLWLCRSPCPSAASPMEAYLLPLPGQRPCKSHLRGARFLDRRAAGPGKKVSVQQYASTARPAGPQCLQSKTIALFLTAAQLLQSSCCVPHAQGGCWGWGCPRAVVPGDGGVQLSQAGGLQLALARGPSRETEKHPLPPKGANRIGAGEM